MKRFVTLVFGLLLFAAQFAAAPVARAADMEAIIAEVVTQLPTEALQRRFSLCIPYDMSRSGPYGGTVSVDGEGCPESDRLSLTTNMVYSNYSPAPGVTADGSCTALVDLIGDYTAGNITGVNVVLSGGPLTYVVNGESYTVTFNDFTVNYAGGLQPVSASGGVTINGTYRPATLVLAGYIL